LAAVLLAGIPLVQARLDARPPLEAREEALFVWKGEEVARLVPGLEGIVADVYWLRVVQNYGSQTAFEQGRDYSLLGPLIDVTVTLDPRMEIAYVYGAIFLAEQPPRGAGTPAAGAALLQRGIRALPDQWRLRQWLGFLQFSYLNDVHGAARVLEEGAGLRGAPYWLRSLAADMLARGCERKTARAVWEAMARDSGGALASNARLHLALLDALDGADQLNQIVRREQERTGRLPASLGVLARSAGLAGPPLDPSGMPYDYDPATGRVQLSPRSKFWRADTTSCTGS
jgi:hypothetical protein